MKTFDGSTLSNVKIYCLLFFQSSVIVLGGGRLVGQNKQLREQTLSCSLTCYFCNLNTSKVDKHC